MKNNSCLPFPPHSPTPCSATERRSLLSVSVLRSKVYLNNVLILFCLDLSTSDVIFWRLAIMDEDLALSSSLSCCRLSPESGDPWLLFICENEGQRSIRGGSVFMGSHWKLWLEWEWRLGVAAGHRAVGFWNARMLELDWGTTNNLCCSCFPRRQNFPREACPSTLFSSPLDPSPLPSLLSLSFFPL